MLLFGKMHDRSLRLYKNVIGSVGLKAIGVALSFVLLPLTVHYLTAVEYGIWATLFSMMNWVNMMDMGLGNGLRNKLTKAVSLEDLSSVRIYIATGGVGILCLSMIFLAVFGIALHFVRLQSIFNTTGISEENLYRATLWAGIFVLGSFALSFITQIYYAYQMAAWVGAMNVCYGFMMLGGVYYLTRQTERGLLSFIFCFGAASLGSKLFFTWHFFGKHREAIPCWRDVRPSRLREILSLGLKFFVIQIGAVVMFSMSNLLITQRLGPEHVRVYDVVFKVFSAITILHGLINQPLWSAYIDACVKGDWEWIRRMLRRMIWLMLPIVLGAVLLKLWIKELVMFWIHVPLDIPNHLPMAMAFYVTVVCWNNIWAMLVNALGCIEVEMVCGIASILLMVPLAWYLMPIFASAGMCMAMGAALVLNGIPIAYQVMRTIKSNEWKWHKRGFDS